MQKVLDAFDLASDKLETAARFLLMSFFCVFLFMLCLVVGFGGLILIASIAEEFGKG
jgi:hypothetical protein